MRASKFFRGYEWPSGNEIADDPEFLERLELALFATQTVTVTSEVNPPLLNKDTLNKLEIKARLKLERIKYHGARSVKSILAEFKRKDSISEVVYQALKKLKSFPTKRSLNITKAKKKPPPKV